MRTCELLGAMLLVLIPTDAIRHRMVVPQGGAAFSAPDLPSILRQAGLARDRATSPSSRSCSLAARQCCNAPSVYNLRSSMADHMRGGDSRQHNSQMGHEISPPVERKKILVTGGAGYIGSHLCMDLLEGGYDVVVLDNFINSSPKSLERVVNPRSRIFTPCDPCTLATPAVHPITRQTRT
jgi:hypothetical protein